MVFNSSIKRMPLKIFFLISFFWTLSSCSQAENDDSIKRKSTRIIDFSGHKWVVRNSDEKKQGPGPNYFSDSKENVWVDEQGRLHLKIVKKEGVWYCSEVTLRHSYGYNKYIFYVASRVDELNENVVGGLFTYKNDEEEIDIEFSKWSDPENEDSQFAVQPSYLSGNKKRFDLNLNTEFSTHFFNWKKDTIEFASYKGHTLNPKSEDLIKKWTYTGNNVPPDRDEKLKINLWLFKGASPTDNNEAEMVIDHVKID